MKTWINLIIARRKLVFITALVLNLVAPIISYHTLGMNTDTANLVSKRLGYYRDWLEFKTEFPDSVKNFIIVIDSKQPNKARTVARVLQARLGNDPSFRSVLWIDRTEIEGSYSDSEIVSATPVLDYSAFSPAKKALLELRKIVDEFRSQDVSVRISGGAALSYEEMRSSKEGAATAGIASVILVALLLLAVLGSWRLTGTIVFCLLTGLNITAALAGLTIGHLNVISVAFAAMFIGLGVDYSLHLSLRIRQHCLDHIPLTDSLKRSYQELGVSLAVCTLTTTIGFLSFLPTSYAGVSELGLIAGMGMIVNFLVHWTAYPAMTALMPPKFSSKEWIPWNVFSTLLKTPIRFPKTTRIVTLVLLMTTPFFLKQLSFDANPLNLHDPTTEAYRTFNELVSSGSKSPWTVKVLAKSKEDLESLASQIEDLPSVDFVIHAETGEGILPEAFRNRYVNERGIYQLDVFPFEPLSDIDKMRAFGDEVLTVAPHATGQPIVLPKTGDAVVEAFFTAATLSAVLCFLFVFFVLKSIKRTVLVFIPLLLGLSLTGAFMVAFKMPINFANIIIVPLLLGMAIDYGIHLVHQFEEMTQSYTQSTTPKSILASALSTIFSFGTLGFALHRGLSSLGILLAVGMTLMVVATLFALPAFQTNQNPSTS